MRKINNKVIILLLIISTILTFSVPALAELEVHFIDVGQGDAILVQTPEGENLLIDAGDRWDWVGERVKNYLNQAEVNTLSIVGTHPHADHIGGFTTVMENFTVEAVYDSGRVHTTKTYENYLRLIQAKEIPFYTPRRGEVIALGDLELEVLHPTEEVEEYSLNNTSIVLRLEYDEVSFLFTGDAEKEAEAEMINSDVKLDATILKVGHHGSNTSTTTDFLAAVEPEVAVIQLGAENDYGFPHRNVLTRLKEAKVDIYRNDKDGDVIIRTDGKDYQIKTSNQLALVGNLVNINTATKAELQELPGVGEVIAARIIKYRNQEGLFTTKEEIKEVSGIGEVRYKELKAKIKVD